MDRGCVEMTPPVVARYYTACEADYWYHGASGGYPGGPKCVTPGVGVGGTPTDLSNNSGTDLRPAAPSLNGTYNTGLLADEVNTLCP